MPALPPRARARARAPVVASAFSIRSQFPIVRRGIGWGSTPSFFLAGFAAHPWGLSRSMSPSVRTLDWGWGFLRFPLTWDDPRLGACAHERAVTYLHMPRLWWPLASRTQPSGAPPVRTPQGPTAEGGHASCQAQLASPRICIQQSRSRGSETNPPVAPGRVASSARQIKVG
jgi:hypothetical protein